VVFEGEGYLGKRARKSDSQAPEKDLPSSG